MRCPALVGPPMDAAALSSRVFSSVSSVNFSDLMEHKYEKFSRASSLKMTLAF